MNPMHRGVRPLIAIVAFALDGEAMKGRPGFVQVFGQVIGCLVAITRLLANSTF
jgi:hypothetical protein